MNDNAVLINTLMSLMVFLIIFLLAPNEFIELFKTIKDLFTIKHTTMNIKILLKAMGYLFVPTLSILTLIFFWFLDFSDFIDFVISKSTGSAILRLILIIAEFILVAILYFKFEQTKKKKQKLKLKNRRKKS